ncbi:hypothetical protein N7523_002843 [Penicillium sp. IBT 18751x]|nr:hypothetical protein N7523_002843 [Penicillium sp. IBT 18751x]
MVPIAPIRSGWRNKYFVIGHTSEPYYCVASSGDSYGMDNGSLSPLGRDQREDIPSAGLEGERFTNKHHDLAYGGKHNPLILFDSLTNNATALKSIKSFSSFEDDLKAQNPPQ